MEGLTSRSGWLSTIMVTVLEIKSKAVKVRVVAIIYC